MQLERFAFSPLFMLLTACSSPATPTQEITTPAATTPAAETAARETAPRSSAPPELGVGILVMPSAEAEALNRTALRAHHMGDFAESLEGFTQALNASPGYAMARFNQACAEARLGREDEAEALLMHLFEEDLPTFAYRFTHDEDLAVLRDGAHGVRLRAHIETLLPRMQAAWSRGVLAYVHAPYPTEPGARSVLGLTMGVIDPTTNRFIPIAPHANDALGMQIDRNANVAFVLHGRVRQGTFWSAYFVPEEVDVFDLSRPFERVLNVSLMALVTGAHELPSVTVQATRDHIDVSLDHIDLAPHNEESARFRITPETREVLSAPLRPSEGTLWVRSDQGIIERTAPPPSTGLRFEGGVLIADARGSRSERRVSLGERHHAPRLLLSPEGTRAFVRSEAVRCSDGQEGTVYRSAFDLVELASGNVTHIETSEDDTLFEGRFAADGTFYFQRGETLRRYAPGSTEAMSDVPANVVLTTPHMAWKRPLNCEI